MYDVFVKSVTLCLAFIHSRVWIRANELRRPVCPTQSALSFPISFAFSPDSYLLKVQPLICAVLFSNSLVSTLVCIAEMNRSTKQAAISDCLIDECVVR